MEQIVKSKPHYCGHRQRMKERFLTSPSTLPDYELVELILYFAYPRRDVKGRAKDLLKEFGSFPRLVQSPLLSPNLLLIFRVIYEASRRIALEEIKIGPILNNAHKVIEYCRVTMAHLAIEQFRLFFLDRKYHLICDELQQAGTVDQVTLYPREVLKRALELNAAHLLMVHNHPSGDPQPSNADIEMTRHLKTSLLPFNIKVLDHFIIGRSGHFSFRENSLLLDSAS